MVERAAAARKAANAREKAAYKLVDNSREGAFLVLEEVDKGAYANIALDKILAGPGKMLSRQDKAFLTELALGTTKYRLYLDYIIDHLLKEPQRLKSGPRNILRLGFYQLCFLDRVPPRAACFETVKLAKDRYNQGISSLANAVFRNCLRDPVSIPWPNEEENPRLALSVTYSHPEWIIGKWLKRYGLEATRSFCEYNNNAPEIWLRTNTLKVTRDELIQKLNDEGIDCAAGEFAPESIKLLTGTSISELMTFNEGLFGVQDQSSMLVAHALNPMPGDRVLDLCSAPGGKATHMAALMKDQGEVIACDVYPHRLELIDENANRLGITCVKSRLLDGTTKPEGEEIGEFSRILVDAPCSGLGVLRRRADARWRKSPDDLEGLHQLQKEILSNALLRLAPGGRLIYSTCTVEPNENTKLVEAVLSEMNNSEYKYADLGLDRFGLPKGHELQLLPFSFGLEGFYMCAIERVNK